MAALHFLLPTFVLLSAASAQQAPPAIGGEIQKLPDCSQLGASALPKKIRERLSTGVVVAAGNMKYDCNLEGFASIFLSNRSLYQVYTANMNIIQSEFEDVKTKDYKVRAFIRKAVKSWADLFFEIKGERSLFGCNYKLDGKKYKVVCLYM
ncbi:hypothetical protein ANCCAN_19314 [Ancylostoma caninum]|uniref:SCP domain-containing protein n=1 Tax=Ancylostoma caninum TaxID=29170 RepID=A0A368FVM6_ANCCA|nr:hypothetical protein ANCCAN_19314 [Ancylostoma caninum]